MADLSTWLLAFVATPALVVVLGYVAVRLHERGAPAPHHPAE